MTRLALMLLAFGAVALLAGLISGAAPGSAAPPAQEATPVPNLSISDETCLSCHGQPGQAYPLGDGSLLDLYVDPLEHAGSIHGSLGYACVQCHADVGEYPHPPFQATDRRDVTLQLNAVCQRCHFSQYELAQDSVHARALAGGNRAAAVCSDCHSATPFRTGWMSKLAIPSNPCGLLSRKPAPSAIMPSTRPTLPVFMVRH